MLVGSGEAWVYPLGSKTGGLSRRQVWIGNWPRAYARAYRHFGGHKRGHKRLNARYAECDVSANGLYHISDNSKSRGLAAAKPIRLLSIYPTLALSPTAGSSQRAA